MAKDEGASIKITWDQDPMHHPAIEFKGMWTHRQIKSLPNELNLAFTKHLMKLQAQGVGKTIQEDKGE